MSTPPVREFAVRRRVEFADTDAAGMAHFTALLRYVEEAEHALYRSLGARAFEWRENDVAGMPRVAVSGEFLAPVRYGEEVEVRLVVREVRARSVRYSSEITRVDSGELVARAGMTVVYASRPHGVRDFSSEPLPEAIRSRLEAVPEERG